MTVIPQPRILLRMSEQYSDQRTWLEGLLARFRLTPTELARRADLNPSTLTRFLQPGGRDGHELSARTVRKIEQALNLSAENEQHAFAPGFAESEAKHLQSLDSLTADVRAAALALKAGRNGVDLWEIRSDTLEGIRLHQGDIAVVDMNVTPDARDRVCVQIYDHSRGTAKTVFRLYEPPFLLAGGTDRPEIADGRNVAIVGVVVASLSPRRPETISSAA